MALPAVRRGLVPGAQRSEFKLAGLAGRLVELSGAEDSAALTLAFGLVREAQLTGEPAAWIAPVGHTFFPPDAADGGIDLDALAVVRLPTAQAMAKAADRLARSGAFGLIVLDLADGQLSMAVLSRLLGLAQKHGIAIVFLTNKTDVAPSLGSLISLRVQTHRKKLGRDEFACALTAVKDKRRAPGWTHLEVCRGPAGLH